MTYLDNSGSDQPSFLQQLARSLGLDQPAQPTSLNRQALAAALSGQPYAPPGAHYAQLPGEPLLLNDSGDASTAWASAPPQVAPAPAPVRTGSATNMHGSMADMPQPGMASAAVMPTGQAPPALTPRQSDALVVPGYEVKGPLTRAQVAAAPDNDKTMPAEEDWDAAAKANAGQAARSAQPAQPSQASIYEQTLKARFDQQEQIYNQANAQAVAARDPETARIFAQRAAMAISEANKINDELSATRKPGTRTLADADLTPAERAAGGEWQVSASGERSQVGGTKGDTVRAPNAEESARLVAANKDPKDYQVADGKMEPIAPAKIDTRPAEIQEYEYDEANRVARGLPSRSFSDWNVAKSFAGRQEQVILGKDGNPIDENLTGPDVYNAVPPTVARLAKGMVDGTIKIPNLTARTDPTAKQAFMVAQQADSSLLDVNKVAARHEIEAGYARSSPGTLGGQVNAGNTAADHLADVVEAADELKNVSGGGVPLIAHIANNIRNNISTQQSGKAGAFEDGLIHYGEEIAKFYAGAQTGETERLRFLTALGAAKSPEEIAGVFRMEARQLGGKFITLDEQVQNVMESAASRYPVVRASTKTNASRITSGLASLDPTGPEATGARSPTDAWPGIGRMNVPRNVAPGVTGAPPTTQGPQPGFIKRGYRFKGGDPSQKGNWEPAP